MPFRDEASGYKITLIAGIVALVTIAFGIVVALAAIDQEAAKLAAISVLTGLIGPTILALLALLTGEKAVKQTNGMNARVHDLEQKQSVDPFAGRGQRKED